MGYDPSLSADESSDARLTWRRRAFPAARHFLGVVLHRMEPERRQRVVLEVARAAEQVSSPLHRASQRRALGADAVMYPTLSKEDQIHMAGLFAAVAGIADLDGDVVECGVGRGRSLVTLARAVELHAPDKEVYGFDSFEGFPPVAAEDIGAAVSAVGEHYDAWDDVSQMAIEMLLDAPAHLVKGFFSETIPERLPERIALLHVDCDLYESTRQVLVHGLPRLASGGTVIFDEYRRDRWPGATKAVDECLGERGLTATWDRVLDRYMVRMP
jgi:hypothetical protein